jgi:hypothetical protein
MRRMQFITGLALVGFSFALLLLIGAFLGGFKETPDGTVDSSGLALGFNRRITLELYGIIFSNASIRGTVEAWGLLGALGLLAHLAGASILVATRRRARSTFRNVFFLTQVLFFPAAIPGLLLGSVVGLDIVSGTADGETFADLPVLWIASSAWVFTGVAISFLGGPVDLANSRQAPAMVSRSPNS